MVHWLKSSAQWQYQNSVLPDALSVLCMRFWMSITVHGLSLNFSCLMLVLPKVMAHGSHWIVSVVSKFWTLPTTTERWLFYAMLSGPVVIKMMQQSQLLGWKSGSQHFPIFSKQSMWTSRPDLQFLCADCAEMGILGEERYDFCVDKVGIWESSAWLLVKDIGYLMVYLICRSQFLFCLNASFNYFEKKKKWLKYLSKIIELTFWISCWLGFTRREGAIDSLFESNSSFMWEQGCAMIREIHRALSLGRNGTSHKTMDYNGWSQI